jgi:hypothetical protein
MGNEGIIDGWGIARAALIDDRDGIVVLITMYNIKCGIIGVYRRHALYNMLATRNNIMTRYRTYLSWTST